MRVTINGHTYPSTIGTMNGVAKIPVSGAVRAAANINAGDVLEVEVETDHTSRTVTVPDDLAAALVGDPDSRAFFDGLSYSRTHAYVSWIEQAKKRETRQSRVTQTVRTTRRATPATLTRMWLVFASPSANGDHHVPLLNPSRLAPRVMNSAFSDHPHNTHVTIHAATGEAR